MDKEIQWKAFEYDFSPKSANWFWVVWILTFGFSFMFYLSGNILFGILILITAFSISIFASRKPDLITIKIISEKIIIKNKEINLKKLESFWIEKNSDSINKNKQGKILIKPLKKLSPYIIIPLGLETDIDQIRNYLLRYLIEEELHESILQTLLEKVW
ncbi:MAG: hypothetical protein KAS02_02385 [Candidatus Pacebacteria bacterium]|nr:hypothetical protein [Candidatus Paceibacterota bacterium]